MELLKVFVGDGTASPASVAAMTKGDVLLLNASSFTPYASGSGDVVVAVCTDKGVEYSSPIKKTNVLYGNYATPVSAVEKVVTAAVGTLDLTTNTTYTIGIQIKEDLRMGTYNKNTEILSSYVTPASTGLTDIVLKADMASTIAKGFAANPLTSAGSPSQLVRVTRNAATALGSAVTVGTSVTFSMRAGQRQVTYSGGTLATAIVPGTILNLNDSWYLVEKVDSTNGIVTLDTAYQGTATSAAAGTTATSAYYVLAANYPDGFTFKFQAISQTMKNRYDQFRMVEFIVITPKGFDTSLSTSLVVTETASTQPVGSYRQVRDMEERAYTNANPLINYREFPFEDFVLNADSTQNSYALLTLTYNLTSGYNYMQSNTKEFPQTLVVAAPVAVDGLFDNTPASGTTFASLFNTWYGSTLISSNPS
jgi:hypothetical protein